MRLPDDLPSCPLEQDRWGRAIAAQAGGIELQGCNAFEWIGCAAAIAGCAGLSGPALVACVAGIAPGCVKCL
jgi:hypothetical protein